MQYRVIAKNFSNESVREVSTLGEAQQLLATWLYGCSRPGIYTLTIVNVAGLTLEELRVAVVEETDVDTMQVLQRLHVKRFNWLPLEGEQNATHD